MILKKHNPENHKSLVIMKILYFIILISILFIQKKGNAQTNILFKGVGIFEKVYKKPLFSYGYMLQSANDSLVVLDSLLQINYNGSDSIFSKSYYKYNSKGELIEITYFNIDESGSKHPRYKHEYILDENGIQFFYIYYQWDSNNIQWTKQNKSEYTFYADGKLKEEILLSYDSSTLDWRNSTKKAISYNENGSFKHDTIFVWAESKKSWRYYMNYESELDENNNTKWEVSSVFESFSNDWTLLNKVVYVYENGKRAKIESFSWSSTLNQWGKWQVDEYIYDNYENEVVWVKTNWNDTLSDWILNYKSEKEYNSNNQMILETNYSWKNEKSEWTSINKIGREYDNSGNKTSEIYHEWNTGTSVWQLSSTSDFYYSPHITSTNKITSEFHNIKIYPNPANEALTIESTNQEFTFCKLYNSTGELVKILHVENGINTYNISELKSGIYFIRVQEKGKNFVRKLVKY